MFVMHWDRTIPLFLICFCACLPWHTFAANQRQRMRKQRRASVAASAADEPTSSALVRVSTNEASTGVASGRNTQTTKFAFPITTGAAFNRTLWQLTGRQIGTEARAMANAGNGYSDFWAPVINLGEPRPCSSVASRGTQLSDR